MHERDTLARHFEQHRTQLEAVAYRMLGRLSEAEDAVQESWIRLQRAGGDDVENLGAFLRTVVSRVCLDMLRARKIRREEAWSRGEDELPAAALDVDRELALADSVGMALLVVLDALSPAERLAFVLHDLFGMPFEQIAGIVRRSEVTTKKLASRARQRVRGRASAASAGAEERALVQALLAALRRADVEAMAALLAPDVVRNADAAALAARGGESRIHGARRVAEEAAGNAGRARFAQLALLNGHWGLLIAPGGRLQTAIRFGVAHGRIARIDVLAEVTALRALTIALPGASEGEL